jgi:hypothetical protein
VTHDRICDRCVRCDLCARRRTNESARVLETATGKGGRAPARAEGGGEGLVGVGEWLAVGGGVSEACKQLHDELLGGATKGDLTSLCEQRRSTRSDEHEIS